MVEVYHCIQLETKTLTDRETKSKLTALSEQLTKGILQPVLKNE